MTAVAVGDGLAVGEAEGQGLAEALAVGEAEVEAEALGDALAPALGLAEGVGEAQAANGGVARVRRVLLTFCPLPPPFRSRAAGTTKAAAPHSRRQNPALELRIRALRPIPAGVYSWY